MKSSKLKIYQRKSLPAIGYAIRRWQAGAKRQKDIDVVGVLDSAASDAAGTFDDP